MLLSEHQSLGTFAQPPPPRTTHPPSSPSEPTLSPGPRGIAAAALPPASNSLWCAIKPRRRSPVLQRQLSRPTPGAAPPTSTLGHRLQPIIVQSLALRIMHRPVSRSE